MTEHEYLSLGAERLWELNEQLMELSSQMRRVNEKFRETEGRVRETCAWFEDLRERLRGQTGEGPEMPDAGGNGGVWWKG